MTGDGPAGSALPPRVVEVRGESAEPFGAGLREALARAVASQSGGGASLSVWLHGTQVVRLHAGDRPDDSLQLVFSVSKAITAVAAAHAHAHGLVDLDAPLASFWPEFDRASTRTITTRMVLSHRSGLAAVDADLTMEQLLDGEDDAAIGVQEPFWEPGTRHGYHAFTYGTLLNGVFRRTVGRSPGEYLESEIVRPMGLDVWLGTPASEQPRIRPISYQQPFISSMRRDHLAASTIPPGSSGRIAAHHDLYNDPRTYGACWPSTSGVASADSLAQLFAATLRDPSDGGLLDADARLALTAPLSDGMDAVLGFPTAFASGVQLAFPTFPMLGRHSYGHEAAGGSVVLADPDLDVAVGFTTDVFPPMMGASPGIGAIFATIRSAIEGDQQ
jgi:CubicO group peptidase (beta-lactamase class C family)